MGEDGRGEDWEMVTRGGLVCERGYRSGDW
jgi:hypothetical protein